MNKSLLALFLVCAIAGMAYGYPYSEEEQQNIQLLNTLQAMEEMKEEVNQQEDDDDEGNAQGALKKIGGFVRGLVSHGGSSQQLIQLLNALEEMEEKVNEKAQAQLIGKLLKGAAKVGKHVIG